MTGAETQHDQALVSAAAAMIFARDNWGQFRTFMLRPVPDMPLPITRRDLRRHLEIVMDLAGLEQLPLG